jgi:hypothetical protein
MKLCECGCNQPAPIAKKTYARVGHVKGQPVRFVNGHQRRRPIIPVVPALCCCGCGQPAPIAARTSARRGHVKGQPVRFVNGHQSRVNNPKLKHGMTGTPEHTAWKGAKARCNQKKSKRFADYGGRGILFLFESFEQFFAELGPRPTPEHSVDRIDNDGHYEPGNVRWSTKSEQARNQRPRRPRSTTTSTAAAA